MPTGGTLQRVVMPILVSTVVPVNVVRKKLRHYNYIHWCW
jgi:hypothetical protein